MNGRDMGPLLLLLQLAPVLAALHFCPIRLAALLSGLGT